MPASHPSSRPDGGDAETGDHKEERLEDLWQNLVNEHRPKFYRKTFVMMLSWIETDLHAESLDKELADLHDVFADEYGFEVVSLRLNSERSPQRQLNRYLAEFVDYNDQEGSLMILYYAGHGWFTKPTNTSKPGDFMLAGNVSLNTYASEKATIAWRNSETILLEAENADILTIFDCCDAGALSQTRAPPRFEYLGACAAGQTTRPPGPTSFTRALIWALKELKIAKQGWFSTSDLRRKIINAPDFPPHQFPILGQRAFAADHIMLSPFTDHGRAYSDESEKIPKGQSGRSGESLDLRFHFRDAISDQIIRDLAHHMRSLRSDPKLEMDKVTFLAKHDEDYSEDISDVPPPIEELLSFTYQPIDLRKRKLRLLEFDRHTTEGQIRMTMQTYDVNGCPVYNALSYVWGPEEPTHTIVINGGTFQIRSNLLAFLTEWSQGIATNNEAVMKCWAKRLWIDQLCINQDDLLERSHQVGVMHDIYRNAEHVIVWLGGKSTANEAAISTLQQWNPTSRTACSEADVLKMRHFIDTNPYWSRLWVVQEVLLAKQLAIYCGGSTLDWNKLQQFVHRHFSQRSDDSLCFGRTKANGLLLMGYVTTDISRRHHYDFMELLDYFCPDDYECADPLDKIFALQGLLRREEQQRIDYHLPLEDVYNSAIKTCMRSCCPPASLQDFLREIWGQERNKQHAFLRLAKTMHMTNLQGKDEELFAQGLLNSWRSEYTGLQPSDSNPSNSTFSQRVWARVSNLWPSM